MRMKEKRRSTSCEEEIEVEEKWLSRAHKIEKENFDTILMIMHAIFTR